jgi:arylsulfatase A-like enzyme
MSTGAPSPRQEVVYGIEPFRAAVREGDWKLVWRTTLPSQVELFNLAQDPGETTNVAAANPEKVAELERRVEALAREAVPPLFLSEALGAAKSTLFASVATPAEEEAIVEQP